MRYAFLLLCGLAWTSLALADKKESANVDLTPKDSGSTLTVSPGDTLTIRLPGNPTTGFTWAALPVDGKSVQFLSLDYVPDAHEPNHVGVGGIYIATFKAVQPGQSSLRLEEKRPWEKDQPPIHSFNLTVNVQAAK
jgi:inhibitor of cysteine peptidase